MFCPLCRVTRAVFGKEPNFESPCQEKGGLVIYNMVSYQSTVLYHYHCNPGVASSSLTIGILTVLCFDMQLTWQTVLPQNP